MTESDLIEITEYFPTENGDYLGIPFIEVFPQLSTDHIETLMGTSAEISDEERTHAPELRMQYAQRIFNIFIPTDEQIEFLLKLWNFILMGYEWRWRASQRVSSSGFSSFLKSLANGSATSNSNPSHRDSMWFCVCVGTPGTGKTSTSLSLLRQIAPSMFYHSTKGEVFQLLHLHLKAPKNARERGMAEEIFVALRDVALQTDLLFPYRTGSSPKTVAEFKSAIKSLCRALNLGILIIDEVDHLFPGTEGRENEAMKFLTDLANIIAVPILLIGTWELLPKLGTHMPLSRRSVGGPTALFRKLPRDEVFAELAKSAFRVQATPEQAEWDDDIEAAFYDNSQGIHDVFIKLHAISQITAVSEGLDRVDAELIRRVASECMSAIAPCIRLLKEGRKEQDREVWDLEPDDFNEFVTRYLLKSQLKLSLSASRRASSATRTAKVASDLTQIIQRLGTAAEQAVPAALAMASAASQESAEQLAAELIKEASRKGPKPSRSKDSKLQANRDAEFEALDAADLRRIVYFAIRERSDVEGALRDAGYLPTAANDVAGF